MSFNEPSPDIPPGNFAAAGTLFRHGGFSNSTARNRVLCSQRNAMMSLKMKMKTMKTSSRTTQTTGTGRYATDQERWNAVVRRDQNADGTFYYSVKTTGVYC